MKPDTETLLRATLRLDDSVAPEVVEVAIAILRGERTLKDERSVTDEADDPPLMLRSEIAARMRVSMQTVSNWATRGRLDTVKDMRGQTVGYTRESYLQVKRGER